ncbi:LysR family transcriptional regulator [Acidovorax sp. MR-S7]|uniref:LysR family transcriptional regulator n=1 Tax=Acidovorax sp. MR-S7 TaxID=1268622 RepID=UPI00039AEF0E|nr:LysR family transcriptional regulator [Acidovorax sp. MR-S7]GAD21889.1 LysR family transcriptional regulator [Acidovorax sp. MR-S7]
MRAHQLQDTALRYFLEVAQCGSITEASARLHVAASALSRQIAGLEVQLGAPLFERHPRGMVLTEAGEILARHARRAHLDAERALGEIGALRGLRAGQVRLATSDAFANELVPRLCARFQQAHQGIRFGVQVLPTAEVPGAVRGGAADIGLCFSRAPEKDIEVAYRQSAPVQALLPPGHALARARCLTLARMARYPLALPPPETTVRQMVDVACSRQGLRLDPVLVSGHARTLLHFVASGGGLSVGSEVAARHLVAAGELVARPIGDQGMDLRDIEVQTLAGRSLPVAAQAFLALLRESLPG